VNKKTLAIIAVIAICAVITVFLQSTTNLLNVQDKRIYCYTWFGVGWYQKDGIMVFGDSYTKQADTEYIIGVKVTNNNTQTLFRVHVDLSYKTSNGSWSTISVPNIGLIDISDTKHTTVSLIDPFLSTWEIQKLDTGSGNMQNVTLPTMLCDDVKVIAYGYATP